MVTRVTIVIAIVSYMRTFFEFIKYDVLMPREQRVWCTLRSVYLRFNNILCINMHNFGSEKRKIFSRSLTKRTDRKLCMTNETTLETTKHAYVIISRLIHVTPSTW